MEVLIDGKKFHVGLEWHTYADKEDAKDRLKEFKEEGYGALLFKVGEKYQVCVSKKEKLKHPILATGFFHLLYGYYYVPLDGGVWVLLKGEDGTVIYENVHRDLEGFEAENSEKVLPFLKDGERRQLSLAEAKGFRTKTGISPTLLLIPLVAVAGLFGLFLVTKTVFKPKPKRTAPVPAPAVTAPAPLPTVPPWGKLDLSCYEQFYEKALREGRGSCEWSLSHKEGGEKGLIKCEEATALMRSFSGLQWGQSADYGSALGYSFSLSGNFFAEDMKKLENLSFAELKLSLSGELRSPQATLSGVLLCQK